MQLHVLSVSANCWKVQAVAHHLGIDLEIRRLELATGDLASPAFRALNPNGKVPTLVDGDFVLWESNTIMRYLAETVPGNSLYPTDRHGRADVNRWLDWELAHYNQAMFTILREVVMKPRFFNQPGNEVLVAAGQQQLDRYAHVLESHLDGRTVLVGDGLTLADYAVGHLQPYHQACPFDWSPFPNIRAFYERLAANPHWQSTQPPAAASAA